MFKKRGSLGSYIPHDSHKRPEGRKDRKERESRTKRELEKSASDTLITIKTETTTTITIQDFNPGPGYRRCSRHDVYDIKDHGYHVCTKMLNPYLHNRDQTITGICLLSMQPCTYALYLGVDPKKACAPYARIKKPHHSKS